MLLELFESLYLRGYNKVQKEFVSHLILSWNRENLPLLLFGAR